MDEISQPYARELARQVDELETENERLRSVLRECLADYSHPNFTDRRGQDLEAALRSLRRAHYVCEDCWYSCPKSGECCRDDVGDWCTCGADEANATIDQALKTE
jgi:hypothetical protein